jgi:hypothetical protein
MHDARRAEAKRLLDLAAAAERRRRRALALMLLLGDG